MNFARAYDYTIAALLILICLAMPSTDLANGVILEKASSVVQVIAGTAPCDDCPCSDDHGAGCCDVTFCNCECHAPLGQALRLPYAPVVACQNILEPSWSLPQVYRPIFVPPQNLA